MINFVMLVGGLMLLVKGADFFVKGSGALAKKLHVPALAIGLTIVAFGTSAPELLVSTLASIQGANDVALGNIIGSNIANIALIIGLSAVIRSISVHSSSISHEIPFGFLAVFVLYVLMQDTVLSGADSAVLSRGDGMVLLSFFVIFLYYVYSLIKKGREEKKVVAEFAKEFGDGEISSLKPLLIAVFIITGLLGLTIGGQLTVTGAIALATQMGLSQALIAVTIVAVGTSLPELATSVIAARKGESDIAIGNILGSNVFNIFFVLGTASTISPLTFSPKLNPDLFFMMGLTVLLFLFALRRLAITRFEGVTFLLLYATYLGFLIWRG